MPLSGLMSLHFLALHMSGVLITIIFKSEVTTSRLTNQCATRVCTVCKSETTCWQQKDTCESYKGSKVNSVHQSSSWRKIEDFDDKMAEVYIKGECMHA